MDVCMHSDLEHTAEIFGTNRDEILVDIKGSRVGTPKITFLIVDTRVEKNFRRMKRNQKKLYIINKRPYRKMLSVEPLVQDSLEVIGHGYFYLDFYDKIQYHP